MTALEADVAEQSAAGEELRASLADALASGSAARAAASGLEQAVASRERLLEELKEDRSRSQTELEGEVAALRAQLAERGEAPQWFLHGLFA